LSSTFDDRLPILRLTDVLQIVDDAEREVLLVAELKHATYFESLGFSLDELLAAEVSHWAHRDKLVVESFEKSVLDRLRLRDFAARLTFLIEDQGAPADLVAQFGSDAMTYADLLSDRELARMTSSVDAISVNTSLLAGGALVERAHTVGLEVYAWTLRAENEFLEPGARIGAVPSDFGDWMGAFLRILSTGVDGVFADQPDLAIEAREVMRSAQ
jgi:glycerophosphoryl diester phosphodiesterase